MSLRARLLLITSCWDRLSLVVDDAWFFRRVCLVVGLGGRTGSGDTVQSILTALIVFAAVDTMSAMRLMYRSREIRSTFLLAFESQSS